MIMESGLARRAARHAQRLKGARPAGWLTEGTTIYDYMQSYIYIYMYINIQIIKTKIPIYIYIYIHTNSLNKLPPFLSRRGGPGEATPGDHAG